MFAWEENLRVDSARNWDVRITDGYLEWIYRRHQGKLCTLCHQCGEESTTFSRPLWCQISPWKTLLDLARVLTTDHHDDAPKDDAYQGQSWRDGPLVEFQSGSSDIDTLSAFDYQGKRDQFSRSMLCWRHLLSSLERRSEGWAQDWINQEACRVHGSPSTKHWKELLHGWSRCSCAGELPRLTGQDSDLLPNQALAAEGQAQVWALWGPHEISWRPCSYVDYSQWSEILSQP